MFENTMLIYFTLSWLGFLTFLSIIAWASWRTMQIEKHERKTKNKHKGE